MKNQNSDPERVFLLKELKFLAKIICVWMSNASKDQSSLLSILAVRAIVSQEFNSLANLAW